MIANAVDHNILAKDEISQLVSRAMVAPGLARIKANSC